MTSNTARAGGCFLAVCIITGFIAGVALGNPMKGVLIGTAVGVAIAVLAWVADLRQR